MRQLPQITAALQVPSLWIAGSRDQVMQPGYVRHLAGYAPDHRIVVLEGVGHLAMRQCPELLASTMASWLKGSEAPLLQFSELGIEAPSSP